MTVEWLGFIVPGINNESRTMLGVAGTGREPHLNPQTYYEQVAPSQWKPPEGDSCTTLYRRAYCGYGDAALPPLYFSVVGAICYWQLLPLWGLLAIMLPLLGLGIHFLVFKGIEPPHEMSNTLLRPLTSDGRNRQGQVEILPCGSLHRELFTEFRCKEPKDLFLSGAGHNPKSLPRSRMLISFVMTVEVASLFNLLIFVTPSLPTRLAESLLLMGVCTLGLGLHIR